MKPHVLIIAAAALLIAADTKEDAAKKDLEKLTGSWKLVSVEREGQKIPDEFIKDGNTTLEVAGEKYTLTLGGDKRSGKHVLDASKTPKEIDSTPEEGDFKGQTFLGIYELKDDTYKGCVAMPGSDRPKDFTTSPGDNRLLFVYERVKKP